MAVLRGMKKKPSTKLFRDLSREFLAKIDYLLQSLDEGKCASVIQSYDVYWETPINMSLSELFSSSASKRKTSKLSGRGIATSLQK